jgi:DegV family protein with EDD domain
MSKVAIVVDSTVLPPADLTAGLDIHSVPLMVIFGEETFKDGIDIQPRDFYIRLATSKVLPTTSQPSPEAILAVFRKLHQEGYNILSTFISSKLSGTVASALQAKEMLPEANIVIVDSKTTAMAAGYPALLAARAAQKGASLVECQAILEKALANSDILFAVDTLEFLHRGGRIGGAARFLGTALNFKPILNIVDGAIEAVERVRTSKKAHLRLLELAEERIGGRGDVRLAVFHANAAETAQEVLQMARQKLNPVESTLAELSPVLGTHTGPATIGINLTTGG